MRNGGIFRSARNIPPSGERPLKRDLMLGKIFYSPNLTNLFYFSAPNIKISDQNYAKMNIFRAVL